MAPPLTKVGPILQLPFCRDFSGSAWNAQALFAAKARVQLPKMRKAIKLANKNCFSVFTEAHSLQGRADALRLPAHLTAFWSNGTARTAGVGIILRRDFLHLFNPINPDSDWVEIEPGRVAVLRLSGSNGALDIFCVYLATGEGDLAPVRVASIIKMGDHIRPRSKVLTVITGDFYFVEQKQDRWSIDAGVWSGDKDSLETEAWHKHVALPHGIHEWEQNQATCSTAQARSRIDRFYNHQHVSHQLDKQYYCTVLEWELSTSRHRPIVFARRTATPTPRSQKPVAVQDLAQAEWDSKVIERFKYLCSQDFAVDNPIRRLLLLKDAIKETTEQLRELSENTINGEAAPDDKLGYTMSCIRALETGRQHRVLQCCRAYLPLKDWINQKDVFANLNSSIDQLREHAVALAREQIQLDIESLSRDLDADPDQLASAKEAVLLKLKRLTPGESTAINAMVDEGGKIHTDPSEIATVLRQHWKGVFKEKEVSDAALQIWMEELFVKDETGCFITGLPAKGDREWNIRRSAVKDAVNGARNTMPGPDGIPVAAYKRLGSFAVDILFAATTAIGQDGHKEMLYEAYSDRRTADDHEFNASLLCCLPKKPQGTDPDLGEFFAGEDTRPLALVNVDNRIIASAARLTWEPILSRYISHAQQGFLKGRQMINNIIDIDYEAMTVSLKHPKGTLLLFDFRAAFPSVSHRFLINSLQALGLPEHAITLIKSLYHRNTCKIAFKGTQYEGFEMQCGVRQGCPLSPLLFAACVDILLRVLHKRTPGGVFKAFADDIGAVLQDFNHDCPIIAEIFSEFAAMSGQELNIKKTVCIPLWEGGTQELEQTLRNSGTTWQGICIAEWGTYLGFCVGPGRCGKAWDKPLKKYLSRCRKWSQLGLGLLYATTAYNTFAASTLSFIAQLERPSQPVLAAQRGGLKIMAPGPKDWRMDADSFYLKELYGQFQSFQSVEVTEKAAKLRVLYNHDCHRRRERAKSNHTIKSIRRMASDIAAHLNCPDQIRRACVWREWYESSFPCVLQCNAEDLSTIGINTEEVVKEIVGERDPFDPRTRLKVRRELQSSVAKRIKLFHQPDPVDRIREKLHRWMDRDHTLPNAESIGFLLAGPPLHVARRVHRNLQLLPSLVAPRVCAAVFRTLFNGWCTERRFQRRWKHTNKCVLGCGGEAEDSIEHYCCCPAVQDTLRSQLRILIPSCSALSFFMLNETHTDPDTYLTSCALITYAAYNATNYYRNSGTTTYWIARDHLRQVLIQATYGHPKSRAFLDSRWEARC